MTIWSAKKALVLGRGKKITENTHFNVTETVQGERRKQRNGYQRRRLKEEEGGRKQKQLRRNRALNEQLKLKSPKQKLRGKGLELHTSKSRVWRKRKEKGIIIIMQSFPEMNHCHKYGLKKRCVLENVLISDFGKTISLCVT